MSAEVQPAEAVMLDTSAVAESQRTARCAHCGQPTVAGRRRAPFGVLLAVARLVIAVGAALALIAIVVSLFQSDWRRFAAGQIWALFATFVLSTGVLVLYEIRDLLLQQVGRGATGDQPLMGSVTIPSTGLTVGLWQTIGWLASRVWLPFQPARDRLLIDHLAAHEQHELFNRLAVVAVCMAATTVMPVLVAFVFLSPEAVCFAVTAIAANLFIFDWFRKRHRRWLYATDYARTLTVEPPSE